MVIRVKKDPPKRYLFGAEAAAAKVAHGKLTAAARKLSQDVPPNIPFLKFISIVGRGGMATVWRAWHRELNRNVAVKVLDSDFATSGADVRQFMMEVRAMTDLHHPGIVQGYGADFADGRYYFVMDFVDGYTLASLLGRKRRLPESDAVIICESVADAMAYAWNTFKIVHCDLKPENLMVDADGTVKVMDLGLCQTTNTMKKGEAQQQDEVIGTPAYISPEQVYGDVSIDCRSDVYSLGATLYHLVTGRMLFPEPTNDDMLRAHVALDKRAPDPRSLVPGLSVGFCRLLSKMTAKDASRRYQTWEDVLADASAVEGGDALQPLPADLVSSISVEEAR